MIRAVTLAVLACVAVAGVATAKPTPAEKCVAAKLKAAKTKAAALLGCAQRAVLRGTGPSVSCTTPAADAFTAAFAKAERKGGCVTIGDAPAREADVDTFVAGLQDALQPPSSTTTTTVVTATTVTTMPGATSSTVVASSTSSTGVTNTTVVTTSTLPGATTTTTSTIPPNVVNGCDPATAQDFTGVPQVTVLFPGMALTFSPACFKVRANTQITFNGSFLSHPLVGGVIEGTTKTPDAQTPIPHTVVGTSTAFVATPAGVYGFYCDNHGVPFGMKGAVVVVP